MSGEPSVRHADRVEAPPLDKRLERFVQRYIDSPLKLEIVRTVAHHPNRLYSLGELAAFTSAQPAEIERAVFYLDQLGIVAAKRQQNGILTGLSRSPVSTTPKRSVSGPGESGLPIRRRSAGSGTPSMSPSCCCKRSRPRRSVPGSWA